MASTFSDDLKIELIADGEQAGTWGTTTNTNWQLVEESISAKATVTLSGSTSTSSPQDIAVSEGASSNGRHAFVELKDAGSDLGATQYFRLTPTSVERLILVRNSLSGSRAAHIRQVTSHSTDTDEGLEVTNGETALLHFDGAGASTAKVIRVFSGSVFTTLTTSGVATLNSAAVTNNISVGGNITVTGTVDGRDIATDGTKLDGVEASATADQSASEILTAIKTVDGTSSGLDADLLDGQEGSFYTNASNIASGTVPSARLPSIDAATLDGIDSTQFLRSDAADEIAASGVPLSVNSTNSNSAKIQLEDNGTVRAFIGANSTNTFVSLNGSGTTMFLVDSSGNIVATGDVTANSDIAFKSDIETLDGNKVFDMRGVSFMKDGRRGSGVVAQEIEKIAPELVHVGTDGKKSVAYGNLVGYLIESVKSLRQEIAELREKK
tara:strand:+ start:570 stop:1886 length:1317 start_codon:yes stop_codon:yes gene_type:complete